MSTVRDIYNAIDKAAPFSESMSFDNTGILVGDPDAKVKIALIALDITSDVVKEAKRLNCDLIISHHPIIFNPAKKIVKGTALFELVASEISAICCHTNLDVSPVCGVNVCLGEALGIVCIKRDEDNDCLFMGTVPGSTSVREFANFLKEKLDAENVSFTRGTGNHYIQTLGFCSGAGGDFVFDALGKCDAYLTGEAKHHELLFAYENKFPMIVAGHYATEKIFSEGFKNYLSGEINDVVFVLSEDEKNPTVDSSSLSSIM